MKFCNVEITNNSKREIVEFAEHTSYVFIPLNEEELALHGLKYSWRRKSR